MDGPDKVLGADLSPYAPDERFFVIMDRYNNSTAQIELSAVNHALVGSKNDSPLQLILWNQGRSSRSLDAVTQRQYVVVFSADGTIETGLSFASHRPLTNVVSLSLLMDVARRRITSQPIAG